MKYLVISLFLFFPIVLKAQKIEGNRLIRELDSLVHIKKYDEALLKGDEYNKWVNEKEGRLSQNYAYSKKRLGDLFYDIGNIDSAIQYTKSAVEVYENLGLKTDNKYIASLNILGFYYEELGDYTTSENYYLKAFLILKERNDDHHPGYLYCSSSLAGLHMKLANWDKAESFLLLTLQLISTQLGEENNIYIEKLIVLADIYKQYIPDFQNRLNCYKKITELYSRIYGTESRNYGLSNIILGNLYEENGNYQLALDCILIANKIFKKKDYEDHYRGTLAQLGHLYEEIGNFELASEYFYQSSEFILKQKGRNHLDYINSLARCGDVHKRFKDYAGAKSYYYDALSLMKISIGQDCSQYARMLNVVGLLFYDTKEYVDAEKNFLDSKEIWGKIQFNDSADYYTLINNLGLLYKDIGKYDLSENYLIKAYSYKKRNLTKTISYDIALRNLASLYSSMDEKVKEEKLLLENLEIQKSISSVNSKGYRDALIICGDFYFNIGDVKKGYKYYENYFNLLIFELKTNINWMTPSIKQKYWESLNGTFRFFDAIAAEHSSTYPELAELSFNGNLISKCLLLESNLTWENEIRNTEDLILKEIYWKRELKVKYYNKLLSEGSINKSLLFRYSKEIDSLNNLLKKSCATCSSSEKIFDVTWRDIQAKLNHSDAAIEFTRYLNRDNIFQYEALMIRPDFKFPKIIHLGNENQIIEHLKNKDFSKLSPLVWEPLEEYLNGVDRIFYSPSYQLNNVAFSALCIGNSSDSSNTNEFIDARGIKMKTVNKTKLCNAFLMDKYELHQLISMRYLIDALENERILDKSITMIGGVNYDVIPTRDTKNDEIYFIQSNKEINNTYQEFQRNSSNSSMSFLEGTRIEIEQIGQLLTLKKWHLYTYSEMKAEEGKIKDEIQEKNSGIIHMATHGFAFPDVAQIKKQEFMEELSYSSSVDPMVRSGLMLSGANVSWTGNPQKMFSQTGEDGIFTAAEVSNLNLSKTKLVVLSACQTGLGKIDDSEGTFGLKRGFKLAGVEQMIVSLWSVPDKETMELMTLFYDDLTESLNPVISFEKAQKEMRNKYPSDPLKWAGFVLVR